MAQKSYNTKLDYGDQTTYGASTNWTSIASVSEIKPPGTKESSIEVTVLDTPNEMKDWLPGIGDNTDASLKVKWAAAQTTTIYGLWRQQKGFRVVYADLPYPSGSKLEFNGWITGIENEQIQNDKTVEATITVKVVGLPNFVAAGS